MSNVSASREDSCNTYSATYQAPPTFSPREGDWILAQVDSSGTDCSIFQVIETPTPYLTSSIRARRYLRPSEITPPIEAIVFDSDEVLQSSLHGTAGRDLTAEKIIGRCLVFHSDDRDTPATPKSTPALPVYFCKRYVTSGGNIQLRTKVAFEKLLAASTRTIFKVEKSEKILSLVTVPKESEQNKRKPPAEFDTSTMLKRARVNVPEVHIWLTCTFELLEPPAGSWISTPLWEMYRTHVALTTGSDGEMTSAANFYSDIADWSPSVRYYNGVACNLRPRAVQSDVNVARWLHSSFVRDTSSYVKLSDVVAEYNYAFPHAPNSAGGIAQQFFGFTQHMDCFLFSHSPGKTDCIVTGVNHRMNILVSPLRSLQDAEDGSAGPSPGEERSPVPAPAAAAAALVRPEQLRNLGLDDFVTHMKARDPAHATHYDEAATILDAALVGPDVLLRIGADKLEALGLKLGIVHRMVMVLEEGLAR